MPEVHGEGMTRDHRAHIELLKCMLPHVKNVVIAGRDAGHFAKLLERRNEVNIALMGNPAQTLPPADYDTVVALEIMPQELLQHLRQIPRTATTLVYAMFQTGRFLAEGVSDKLNGALSKIGYGIYTQMPLCDDSEVLVVCVPVDYDPVAHARALYDVGQPAFAYRVLELVPVQYRSTPESAALIASEMLIAHMAWARDLTPGHIALHFAQAQTLFYETIANAPTYPPAYQCLAEYWRMLGNPQMGARLLRSLLHVAPNEAAQRQYVGLKTLCESAGVEKTPEPPECPPNFRPRVLLLLNQRPHFGLDVLYDGLCRVLGPDNVTDFPPKETLHGMKPELLKNYPCCFDWPSHAETEDSVVDDLRMGAYDFVLFGDCENSLPEALVAKIVAAKGDTPLVVIDALDEATDARLFVKRRLADAEIAGYFKREMLTCVDYGPNVFPLPFACPDHLVRTDMTGPRDTAVFWAGHRQFGMRRLYLEHLEKHFGWDLNTIYSPDEYANRLLRSRIGINIFGYGFDTVRFWELPANGCLLLSERLPIHIPRPFTHGVNAVFFDDLPALAARLEEHIENPEHAREIAHAGHAHLRAHHTGSRRAEQMLGWLHTLG